MTIQLTPEQEALIPVFREKYNKHAIDGSRIEPKRLNESIDKAYKIIGQKPPELRVLGSPLSCLNAIREISGMETREIMGHCLYGAQEIYLVCWTRFAEHVGVKLQEPVAKWLDVYEEICKQSDWWWPYEGICFCSEKPSTVKFDANEQLHCPDGPAIAYDDWKLYCWHGVSVPEHWIEDRNLTAKEVLQQKNTELRRAAAEILGWDAILREIKAVEVDKDKPAVGTLLEGTIDGRKEKFLRVKCGTGRYFALPVPPEMKTARQANAWTYDVPESKLPEIRT